MYLPLLLGVMFIHFTFRNLTALIILDVLLLGHFKFFYSENLPFGISFYIFQCMAYSIDTLSRDEERIESMVPFFASVSFFPHLPAGPLLKTRNIVRYFEQQATWESCRRGMFYFALGLMKKTIADLLIPVTESHLTHGATSTFAAWTGSIAGLARLYGDFSGYTDMAWGLALMIGIELPVNFYRPFSATSIRQYYAERWHITLADWIKSYLLMPIGLAFSRKNIPVSLALILTFIIMGFWHGSKINFLAWGMYVAILILIEEKIHLNLPKFMKMIGVNFLVMIGLIFFFSEDMKVAFQNLSMLFSFDHQETHGMMLTSALTMMGFITLIGLSFLDYKSLPKIETSPIFWTLIVLFVFLSFTFSPSTKSFIYFDF